MVDKFVSRRKARFFFVISAFFIELTTDNRYGGEHDDRVFATSADKCFLPEVQFLWEGKLGTVLNDTELGEMLSFINALTASGHANPRGV